MLITLPDFLQKTAQGLMVDLRKLKMESTQTGNAFLTFVDTLFASGARFSRLNYATFTQLIFTPGMLHTFSGTVRLADGVVPFPASRQNLYKGVRFLEQNHQAEYIFEPVMLEVPFEHPLYGDKLADGTAAVIGFETRTRLEKASLDVDEFIAALWLKGVRFGLQLAVFEKAVASSKIERLVVAQAQLPKLGTDALLQDEFAGLRSNNRVDMVNGKADLRRYKNRYPHIAKDRTLLKKIPVQPGSIGFTVTGEPLETSVSNDFDLALLAGAGTRIAQLPDGWGLVAALDGFISLDEATGQLTITEKIETKVHISAKNTGDLALGADEFISHGEVQEGRIVKGKHMRFTAAVYGNLLSDGGNIVLEDNLSGGTAIVSGTGSISVIKRAFNARIEAPLGQIDLNYVENSLIIADSVFIAHAVNCVILANSLQITYAQACTVAAKSLDIEKTDARKGTPAKIAVSKPSLNADLQKIDGMSAELLLTQKLLKQKSEQLAAIKKDPEFAKFLAMREAIQSAKLPITPEIDAQYSLMQRAQSINFKTIERLVKEIQTVRSTFSERSAVLKMMEEAYRREVDRYYCHIAHIADETSVYSIDALLSLTTLADKRFAELKSWIDSAAAEGVCVFSGETGTLDWRLSSDI